MKYLKVMMLIGACIGALGLSHVHGQPAQRPSASELAKIGLFVRLEAKPGKEDEVAKFLIGGKEIVDAEPATHTWFAIRLNATTFAIFDTFSDEEGRKAHLAGKVAAALMAQAPQLLAQPPVIEKADILAVKLPDFQSSK